MEKWSFKFWGYSLHDYASRSLLEAMNLGPETKRLLFTSELQTINSQLANYFYRLAVPALSRLKGFNDFKPYNQALQLVIEGQKNLLEVKALRINLSYQLGRFTSLGALLAHSRHGFLPCFVPRGGKKF